MLAMIRLTSGWPELWEAAWEVCFPAVMLSMQRCAGDSASTPRASRLVLSHPTISQKTSCGLNSALSQDFSSPSYTSTSPFILWNLLQDTVPANIPLPMLFAITWLWDRRNYLLPYGNMDTWKLLQGKDYSDHWDNCCGIDSQNKSAGREKKTFK